eukprot:12818602-Heterocapsa_arctica.AAC.1
MVPPPAEPPRARLPAGMGLRPRRQEAGGAAGHGLARDLARATTRRTRARPRSGHHSRQGQGSVPCA